MTAKVDTHRVRYYRPKDLGIDFTNEIDVWTKMEFRYRKQIKGLVQNPSLEGHDILKDLNSLVYALREKID
ncbi:MAG: hypothetical protein AB7I27_00165 [Bacteriovoracaceae bacterium]